MVRPGTHTFIIRLLQKHAQKPRQLISSRLTPLNPQHPRNTPSHLRIKVCLTKLFIPLLHLLLLRIQLFITNRLLYLPKRHHQFPVRRTVLLCLGKYLAHVCSQQCRFAFIWDFGMATRPPRACRSCARFAICSGSRSARCASRWSTWHNVWGIVLCVVGRSVRRCSPSCCRVSPSRNKQSAQSSLAYCIHVIYSSGVPLSICQLRHRQSVICIARRHYKALRETRDFANSLFLFPKKKICSGQQRADLQPLPGGALRPLLLRMKHSMLMALLCRRRRALLSED